MLKALELLLLMALLLGSGWPSPRAAAAGAAASQAPADLPAGPLDFETCARLAIRQSPYLTKSAIEIDIRRLAETDSKVDFLPSVNFRSRYYVSDLSRTGFDPSPYSLEFVSEPYSPIEAYFSLQVRKLLTKTAKLQHLQAMADGLHRLGRAFLELAAHQQLSQSQAAYVAVAEQALAVVQTRLQTGGADQLELKIAAQDVAMARQAHQRLRAIMKNYQESIKAYLGWPKDQELPLNLTAVRQQVLGGAELDESHREAPPPPAVVQQLQEIQRELQRYNITLAKTKLLPTLFAGVQTPDPLSNVQNRSLFFFVGASLPVWDGGKRLRHVSRQKAILSQQEAERQEQELERQEKWREAQAQAAEAAAQLRLSHGQLELAELKRRQQEIRVQKLGEPFSQYLDSQKNLIAAQREVILRTLEYDLARLHLRHLSHDLLVRYVAPEAWDWPDNGAGKREQGLGKR